MVGSEAGLQVAARVGLLRKEASMGGSNVRCRDVFDRETEHAR